MARTMPVLLKGVILDTNSKKPCCETVRLLHADPHLSCLQKLRVLTVVCYSPEKNIRYKTGLIEHFIVLHFVFNVFWDPSPVKIVSAIAIYTRDLQKVSALLYFRAKR